MSNDLENFFDEWDYDVYDDEFGNGNAFEVYIYSECEGRELEPRRVWAEDEQSLRNDLVLVMADCEAVDYLTPIT